MLLIGMVSFTFSMTPVATAVYEEDYDYVEEGDIQGPGDDFPDEDDVFWDIAPLLDSPTDSDCVSVATAAFTNLGTPDAATQATSFCTQFSQMESDMQSDFGGVANELVETNLFDATDWHAVDGLYFQHSTGGVLDGRVEFNQPIDFMEHDFMYFMSTFGERIDMEEGRIGIEASIVDGLADYTATLTMYGITGYDNPIILIDGEEDTGNVVSNIVYDSDAGTVTFTADHFSTFEVAEDGALGSTPKIHRVKAEKYKVQTV